MQTLSQSKLYRGALDDVKSRITEILDTYLADVSFADDDKGRLLEALDLINDIIVDHIND